MEDGMVVLLQSSIFDSVLLLVSLSPCLVFSGALLVGYRGVSEERSCAADDGVGYAVFALGLDVGKIEHDVVHDLFDDAAQAAGAGVAILALRAIACSADGSNSS